MHVHGFSNAFEFNPLLPRTIKSATKLPKDWMFLELDLHIGSSTQRENETKEEKGPLLDIM